MPAPGFPPLSQAMSACSIASAASTSNSIDLGFAAYSRLVLTYATMSTGAALQVQGSVDDSTFKNVHTIVPTSSAAQYQPLTIATSVSATGYAVFQAPGLRYVRFLASATVDNGAVITVYGAH